jgi:hypothetical protein
MSAEMALKHPWLATPEAAPQVYVCIPSNKTYGHCILTTQATYVHALVRCISSPLPLDILTFFLEWPRRPKIQKAARTAAACFLKGEAYDVRTYVRMFVRLFVRVNASCIHAYRTSPRPSSQ